MSLPSLLHTRSKLDDKLPLALSGQGIRDGPKVQGRSLLDRESTPGTGQGPDTTLGLQLLVEAVNDLASRSSASWITWRKHVLALIRSILDKRDVKETRKGVVSG